MARLRLNYKLKRKKYKSNRLTFADVVCLVGGIRTVFTKLSLHTKLYEIFVKLRVVRLGT